MSDVQGAIVILGMHRSGTSCVSNLLTKCGVYFGNSDESIGTNPENPKGFFERRDIRWVCDTILQGLGCDWWAISDFSLSRVPLAVRKQANDKLSEALQDLTAHQPWFIKEPRLCLVWPAIESAVPKPLFLHVWRDPLEVAQSLAHRNGFPLDFCLALWEVYVRSAFRASHGARTIVVSYNALVAAPKAQASKLVKKLQGAGIADIKLPVEQDIIDAVDAGLHRQKSDNSLDEFLTPSQRRLLEALDGGDETDPELSKPPSAACMMRIDDWVRREGAALSLKTAAFNARGAMAESARWRTVAAQLEQNLKAAGVGQTGVAEELKTLKQERIALESKIAAERSSLMRQIEELTGLASRQGEDAAAASGQRKALESELREMTIALSQLQARQAEQQDSLQIQIKDLVALVAVRDQELNGERARLENEAAGRRESEQQWAEERSRSEQAAAAERARLDDEIDSLRTKIQIELAAERRQLEDEIRSIRESSEQQRRADLTVLADSMSEIEKLKAQAQTRENGKETLNAQIASRDAALQQLSDNYDQLARKSGILREEVKRRDAYIEKVRLQIPVIRKSVTQQFARALDQAELLCSIKAKQIDVSLAYAKTSQISLAWKGLASHKPQEQSREEIHRGLVRHYSYLHGRKDASDLATIALSGLFDRDYYLKEYADIAKAEIDPLIHYVDFGVAENRNPSVLFDTAYYLSTTDGVPKDVNPILHYLKTGLEQGRPPRPAHQRKVDLGNWTLPAPIVKAARKPFTLDKRVVIYTAVSGGYDDLKPPAVRPPNCDFVAFSDRPMNIEGWQVRPINYLHQDTTRAARFTKLHPHFYFPEYEYSIWIDGNIGVRGDVREFISALTDETPVGIFLHPLRRCIYVEGEECIKRKKDNPDVIKKHLARYSAEGFPRNAGLWETNVVVRRHNDPNCIALMNGWWREMEIGSRRDQLSLPVVAHRLGVKIAPLDEPGVNAREHDLVTLTKHPAERKTASIAEFPATARKKIDAENIPIAVGICVHNSPAESKACIESVLDACNPHDTVIVVDDASNGETAAMLDGFAAKHKQLQLIRHENNRGYTPSANDVLKSSRAPWTFLLNSDTIVPPRALRKIVACGEQFEQIGIVGPLSNAASWQSVPQLTGQDGKFKVNEIPPGVSIADMDELCEELATGIVPFVPLLNGFCYAVRQKLTEKIGFLDEKSFPVGYGEEDDFSLRAGAAGYVCAIATDAYIFHAKSVTFTAERRKPLVEQGAVALRRKHSPERLAASTQVLRHNPELARIRELMMQRLGRMMAQGAE